MSDQRTLIVAEKPSVAGDIAKVLGATSRRQGYYEGKGCVVTWCVGHLVGLAPPDDYDPRLKKWSFEGLPIIPQVFRLRSTSAPEQFERVRTLMLDAQFDEVVNACDAGREGELIFAYVYELAGSRLPIRRLWISSMTEQAIRQGFANLEPGEDYEDLAAAARARSQADWLIGMNATRAVTVSARQIGAQIEGVVSVGRVQTPTLALIVRRDQTRGAFKPTDFFTIRATFGLEGGSYEGAMVVGLEDLSPTRLSSKEDARRRVEELEGLGAKVVRVETKKGKKNPPRLYDLTTLQREANTRHGLSAARTLELAQALYERHRLLTYPRTDSRHITRDMAQTMPTRVEAIAGWKELGELARGLTFDAGALASRVMDDAKVTDHHAIVPTELAYSGKGLSDEERIVYEMVCRRTLAALAPPATTSSTLVVTGIGKDGVFVTRGTQVLTSGWLVYEREAPKADGKEDQVQDVAIPRKVVQGRDAEVSSLGSKSGRTKPPAAFNEASLLGAMERAGSDLSEESLADVMKGSGLGTPATRASVIERLLKRGYIERSGKKLLATPMGVELIDALSDFPAITSATLTAKWEETLSGVAQGTYPVSAFIEGVTKMTRALTAHFERTPPRFKSASKQSVGACPACSGQLFLHVDGIYCEHLPARTCTLWVPRKVAGKKLTDRQLTTLLNKKKTTTLKGFVSKKSEKTFSAALELQEVDRVWRIRFVFESNQKTSSEVLEGVRCPSCAQTLYVSKTRVECVEKGCGFGIWRVVAGKSLTHVQLQRLIAEGKTPSLKGFVSRKKEKFAAVLVLEQDAQKKWKTTFDFDGTKGRKSS